MQKLTVVFNFCIENPCISLYHETFPPVGWGEHRAKWNILVQLDFSNEREKKGNECLCLFVSKGLANANKFKTHIFFKRFSLVSSTIFASKTRFDSWMVSQKIRLSCRFPALQTIFDSIKSYNCSRTRDNLYLSFFFCCSVRFLSFSVSMLIEILLVIAGSNYIYQHFLFLSTLQFIFAIVQTARI